MMYFEVEEGRKAGVTQKAKAVIDRDACHDHTFRRGLSKRERE